MPSLAGRVCAAASSASCRCTWCGRCTCTPQPALTPSHQRLLIVLEARGRPYYIFTGELQVSFTGVVEYDRIDCFYERKDIQCPTVKLDANSGKTSGVYAGFDFRRKYIRQTLPCDLSEELLESAVPYTELTGPIFSDLKARQTAGAGVEAFQMKPGFAYVHRVEERLPPLAQQLAQAKLATILRGEDAACVAAFEGAGAAAGESIMPWLDPRAGPPRRTRVRRSRPRGSRR